MVQKPIQITSSFFKRHQWHEWFSNALQWSTRFHCKDTHRLKILFSK